MPGEKKPWCGSGVGVGPGSFTECGLGVTKAGNAGDFGLVQRNNLESRWIQQPYGFFSSNNGTKSSIYRWIFQKNNPAIGVHHKNGNPHINRIRKLLQNTRKWSVSSVSACSSDGTIHFCPVQGADLVVLSNQILLILLRQVVASCSCKIFLRLQQLGRSGWCSADLGFEQWKKL